MADTDNLRGSELRGALIERLHTSGVRVVAVPDGAAAGVLLDNYLQTGNTEGLDGYLAVLPAADRDSARTLWEGIYRSYPGVFHAAAWGLTPAAPPWAKRCLCWRTQATTTPKPRSPRR